MGLGYRARMISRDLIFTGSSVSFGTPSVSVLGVIGTNLNDDTPKHD